MKRNTVALVDDHPLMVDGMLQLLSKSPTLEVAAVGSTSAELIDICKRHKPELFVVDPQFARQCLRGDCAWPKFLLRPSLSLTLHPQWLIPPFGRLTQEQKAMC